MFFTIPLRTEDWPSYLEPCQEDHQSPCWRISGFSVAQPLSPPPECSSLVGIEWRAPRVGLRNALMPETRESRGERRGTGCIRLPAGVLWRCSQSLCRTSERDSRRKASPGGQERRSVYTTVRFAYGTCPVRRPPLSIQRKRDDDWPLMAMWPGFTDFSSSTPGSAKKGKGISQLSPQMSPLHIRTPNTHCKQSERRFLTLGRPESSADTSPSCDYLHHTGRAESVSKGSRVLDEMLFHEIGSVINTCVEVHLSDVTVKV